VLGQAGDVELLSAGQDRCDHREAPTLMPILRTKLLKPETASVLF
jgi:hypothetical protein